MRRKEEQARRKKNEKKTRTNIRRLSDAQTRPDVAHPPDNPRVARLNHRHLEHFLDQPHPVSMDDMIAPVDPRSRHQPLSLMPPLEFLTPDDPLELDLRRKGGDLPDLNRFLLLLLILVVLPTRQFQSDNIAAEETFVDYCGDGFEDFAALAGGVEHFEVAWS